MAATEPNERTEPLYDRAVRTVTAGLFLVMITITCAGIFARYVLNNSLVWADTVSLWLFVWLTFFGAAVAVRRGAHMAMDVVREGLPDRLRLADAVIAELAVLGASGFLVFSGTALVQTSGDSASSATGLTLAWAMTAIPVGGAMIALEASRRLLRIVRTRHSGPDAGSIAAGTVVADGSPADDGGGQ